MYRLKPIRVIRRPRPPHVLFQGAHAAFWLLLVAALGIGGGRAVAGFPALLGIILPPGIVAAQASDAPHDPAAYLQIDPPLGASRFAPQVLYPLVTHEFPD